jgi:transposase InsO family protein
MKEKSCHSKSSYPTDLAFRYSAHGSDFTSKRMEQVIADLPMELIFSQESVPHDPVDMER